MGNKHPFTLSIYMAKDLTFQHFFCCSNHTPAAQLLKSTAWIPDNPVTPSKQMLLFFLVYFFSWNSHVLFVLKLSSNSISILTESSRTFFLNVVCRTWNLTEEKWSHGYPSSYFAKNYLSNLISVCAILFCRISSLLISERKVIWGETRLEIGVKYWL